MPKKLIYPSTFDSKRKTLILGYAPELYQIEAFFLSVIPIQDAKQINYEAQTEEGLISLISSLFLHKDEVFSDFDEGYLSAETNVGEEELEELKNYLQNQPFQILFTQDFLKHPLFSNILSLTQLITQHTQATLFFYLPSPILPQELPETNGMMAYITQGESTLCVSKHFATLGKLTHLEKVQLCAKDLQCDLSVCIDSSLRGSIAIAKIPTPYTNYPYQSIKLTKIRN